MSVVLHSVHSHLTHSSYVHVFVTFSHFYLLHIGQISQMNPHSSTFCLPIAFVTILAYFRYMC